MPKIMLRFLIAVCVLPVFGRRGRICVNLKFFSMEARGIMRNRCDEVRAVEKYSKLGYKKVCRTL